MSNFNLSDHLTTPRPDETVEEQIQQYDGAIRILVILAALTDEAGHDSIPLSEIASVALQMIADRQSLVDNGSDAEILERALADLDLPGRLN